ncbi:hypothetical protein Poli38472_007159 [Pythium oligandrum]|uniref:FYVE-type domain-containing protein n=1 Tax=Pythium oligandrum TaxID=41045 RepID=A0A8K1C9M4_PYTOL|nr:hypothetical protein Poli38472_007159 [Pythium oligandrum]|eukprot:TMW59014.1 hypothetical protein Poli38472_007159 [Pythium oligandrum]
MLEFPLPESFFPQIALNADEVKYYKRLGKERLDQLMRIAEDADYAYKWTDLKTKYGTSVQKTQFLDFRPANKATYASVLVKSSVLIRDTRPEEILQAIAKTKTKEYRKSMAYLHGNSFADGRTLFKFPSAVANKRPDYSYRAIKWCAYRGKGRDEAKSLDFAFLEYAGKKSPTPGSMVVGFCLQESIQRERQLPVLEGYGIVRGFMSRTGVIISRTHHANAYRVTSICQIDGDIEPVVRSFLEEVLQESVGAIVRLQGLLDRQRVSSMKFLEQWEWVANSDRKVCAVCTKGFFFHRKHHCRACGEVVCSSCAPLRELDEPVYDITQLRICQSCMVLAGSKVVESNNLINETVTSSENANSHDTGKVTPKNNPMDDRRFQEMENNDRAHRPSDAARMLLQDGTPQATPRRRRLSSMSNFIKDPQGATQTLVHLVDQIRDARDTINITISDGGESHSPFGEEDAYSELYDQANRLRQTVEGDHDADGHELDDDASDLFGSVMDLTFQAARATRFAGEKVLSSRASDFDDFEEVEDVLNSPSSNPDDFSGSTDPYAPSNYNRLMKYGAQQERAAAARAAEQARLAPPLPPRRPPVRPKPRQDARQDPKVRLLEKKIMDLERELRDAHRKLSFFEVDEPEPEYNHLPVLHEDPYFDADDFLRQTQLQQEPRDGGKPRPKSDGTLKPNLPPPIGIDFDENHPRDIASAPRPPLPPTSGRGGGRANTIGRAPSTADMVSELHGVMNSIEMVKPRRASASTMSPPPQPGSNRSSLSRSRPPPPPLPMSAKRMYIDENGQLVEEVQTPKASPKTSGLEKTASSTASYQHFLNTSFDPSVDDSVLDSERYHELMAHNDVDPEDQMDLSFSEASGSHHNFFGQHDANPAFFGNESMPSNRPPPRGADVPPARPSPVLRRGPYDETDELRALADGLTRPRSISAPFRSNSQLGGSPTQERGQRPVWSDGASVRREAAQTQVLPRHPEDAVVEIRACLASLHRECPSQWEHHRKLVSVFKILKSLHRDGARSRFRSLNYEDIRYEKALQETPSVIKLLKLAGYISLPQKLTMRNVDPQYLALFLTEIDFEINEMQASQDYL